jgi:PKD repeat protein
MKYCFKTLLISAFVTVLSTSCTEKAAIPPPAPFAVFDVINNGCTATCEISFNNKSENTETYQWNFGDNSTTSTEKSPKHTYKDPGTYIVTLTATGKGGATTAKTEVFIDKPISKAFISRIVFEKIPFKRPDGTDWDDQTGADIYFTISTPSATSTPPIYKLENELMYRDLGSIFLGLPFFHPLPTPLELNGLDNTFWLNIYDNDNTNVNEYMGSVPFKLSDYTKGALPYPTSIRSENGVYAASLIVSWAK